MQSNASVAEYRLLQKRIGMTRTVIVTPAAYVTDNRVTLDGIAQLAGWRLGGNNPTPLDTLPTWALVLVVIRAGFVEELFARGYAIERLEALTGSRIIAIGLPLILFAVFHYRQGWAGVTIALLEINRLEAVEFREYLLRESR